MANERAKYSIYVPAALMDRVDEIAAETERSRNQIVERLLTHALRYKRIVKAVKR